MATTEKRDIRYVHTMDYVRVIYDNDWGEYQVGYRDVPVSRWGDEVYHTSDRVDAIDTAEVMNNMRREALA